MAEVPYKIAVADESIQLLKQKLALTTFPDELENAGWEYGVPLADVRRLIARWKDGYDWRKYEAQINEELPQFTRDIDVEGFGKLNIHYVHKKSEVANAIPLLFVHGWPGSFTEVQKVLPLLIQGGSDYPAFHVVALGIPGFGFSEAPTKPGFALAQYAEVANKLMLALGYNEYVTQGGDWGFTITLKIAQDYGGKHSKAWHVNSQLTAPPHPTYTPSLYLKHLFSRYTAKEKEGLKRTDWFFNKGYGYHKLHETYPQTIGYSLADSPAGLLAWIYEKLVTWSDSYPWDDDEVLTWISIYWFSRAGPAAASRIYYEVLKPDPLLFKKPTPTSIPKGISAFPKDIFVLPRSWYSAKNLVFVSEHDKGGHFASHETPQELVDDVRKMFGKQGPCFGVVPGKNGFA
ncbi:alpha/beta-hydrolase [Agrocybe pediades]|nr:alpha/beta-hydrolase [Agrocybe pediades]